MAVESGALFERVRGMVWSTPAVDVHSHLLLENTNARDLADLVFYHFLEWEMVSSGLSYAGFPKTYGAIPAGAAEAAVSPGEAVRRALPYLAAVRNTGTFRALHGALRDLYGFEGERLDERGCELRDERIAKTSGDAAWTREVIGRRANVERTVTVQAPSGKLEGPAPELFALSYEEGVFFTASLVGLMREALGEELTSPGRVCDAAEALVASKLDGGFTSFTGHLSTDAATEDPKKGAVRRALDRKSKKGFRKKDIPLIAAWATHRFLDALGERRGVAVVSVGAEFGAAGGASLPAYGGRFMLDLARVAAAHPDVRFLVMLASREMHHGLNLVAKSLPNVYATGHWWHSHYPFYIEEIVSQRIDAVPMRKWIAFFSDAYMTEWVYAKALQDRNALAKALARRIEEGEITEGLAQAIAREVLYETPRRAYFGE